MARLNEILVGRFNRGLQKLFGIKGSPPVATLAPEIMPVHPLETGAEGRYLEGWNRFAMGSLAGGVAGNTSGLRLRNPTGSNLVAVIEKFIITNEGAAVQLFIATGGAVGVDLATIISLTGARLDPRGQPQPNCIFSQQNTTAAIAGLTNVVARVPLNTEQSYDVILTDNQELPLLPGDAYQVVVGAVATACTMTMIWRERPLEESERQ